MEEKIWFHMCMHDTGGHLISSGGLTEGKGGKGGGGGEGSYQEIHQTFLELGSLKTLTRSYKMRTRWCYMFLHDSGGCFLSSTGPREADGCREGEGSYHKINRCKWAYVIR